MKNKYIDIMACWLFTVKHLNNKKNSTNENKMLLKTLSLTLLRFYIAFSKHGSL